jgi:hypothetical protein
MLAKNAFQILLSIFIEFIKVKEVRQSGRARAPDAADGERGGSRKWLSGD